MQEYARLTSLRFIVLLLEDGADYLCVTLAESFVQVFT